MNNIYRYARGPSFFVSLLTLLLIVFYALTINKKYNNNSDAVIEYCHTKSTVGNISDAVRCDYDPRRFVFRNEFIEPSGWVRIQVRGSGAGKTKLAVKVGPHFLTEIKLFSEQNEKWIVQEAGSGVPAKYFSSVIGGYTFNVERGPAASEYLYLHIRSIGLSQFSIDVHFIEDEIISNAGELIGIGVHLGALTLLFGYAMLSYLAGHEPLMLRFCVLALNILLCVLSGSGVLATLFFSDQPILDSIFFSLMICLRAATLLWFFQGLLRSYSTPSWYEKFCLMIYVMTIICSVLIVFNLRHMTMLPMTVIFMLALLVQFGVVVKTENIPNAVKMAIIQTVLLNIFLLMLVLGIAIFASSELSKFAILLSRALDFINLALLLWIVTIQQRNIKFDFETAKKKISELSLRAEIENKLMLERKILVEMLLHDLKTPVATINFAVQSLSQKNVAASWDAAARTRNIETAIGAINQILASCSAREQLADEAVIVGALQTNVHKFINSLRIVHDHWNRIDIVGDANIEICIDTSMFQTVVINLIDNALKYSSPSDRVRVSVQTLNSQASTGLVLIVENRIGPFGSPDPNQVFVRRYRNPLVEKILGTGLGLYIVKSAVLLLGGTVSYSSNTSSVFFVVEIPEC